jgi:hypothetical protein
MKTTKTAIKMALNPRERNVARGRMETRSVPDTAVISSSGSLPAIFIYQLSTL